MLSPFEKYQLKMEEEGFLPDPSQYKAIELLDALYEKLKKTPRLKIKRKKNPINGIYLWGNVGRGKTFLMDIFYNSLPTKRKLRLHFHHFMARIHRDLHNESGHADPLKRIAKQLAKECNVLCFDEFFVSDICDAMILGRLLEALFEQNITFVATSNIPISNLYSGGLQYQRFKPAIELLSNNMQEINLNGEKDHRLRCLQAHKTYFLTKSASFEHLFNTNESHSLNDKNSSFPPTVLICGRLINAIRLAKKMAWFSFQSLCTGPRSQLDYIELASRFDCIILSDIPKLGVTNKNSIDNDKNIDTTKAITNKAVTSSAQFSHQDDPARRFISLVDEFYDRRVNLYLSAEVPLDHLYSEGALSFEFRRTKSRLIEMQSTEYLQSQSQEY
jgi:cell division protein ZapE